MNHQEDAPHGAPPPPVGGGRAEENYDPRDPEDVDSSDAIQPYEPPPDEIDKAIEAGGYYWCQDSKRYAIKNSPDDGAYLVSDEPNMLRELAKQGYSRTKPRNELRSLAEVALDRIRNTRQVDYIGKVCGRQAGYHENNGIKILCPSGFTMIEPREGGECPDLMYFWESLFGKEENPHYKEQTDFMRGWLKSSRQALRNYKSEIMGQVVVLVGPRDCGKSFFQRLITSMLSGRVADASNVFIKNSKFNSVLWGAEHLLLGDEELIEAIRDRHPMLPTLKKIVTANEYAFTKKYGDEQTLRPVWRVTISVNDDPDSLRIIPGPEANFGDKISYLKCYMPKEPFHDGSEKERTQWRENMMTQLPFFLRRMVDRFTIPAEKKSSRFTIQYFHHPEVIELVTSSMPSNVFGEILIEWVRNVACADYDGHLPKKVTGSAVELYRKMIKDGIDLRGICPNQTSFGSRLGHLATTEKWKNHISRVGETWHVDALTPIEREQYERSRKRAS
jgi:hypothetical protein